MLAIFNFLQLLVSSKEVLSSWVAVFLALQFFLNLRPFSGEEVVLWKRGSFPAGKLMQGSRLFSSWKTVY